MKKTIYVILVFVLTSASLTAFAGEDGGGHGGTGKGGKKIYQGGTEGGTGGNGYIESFYGGGTVGKENMNQGRNLAGGSTGDPKRV